MSLALRKRLEREYGQGNKGAAKKRSNKRKIGQETSQAGDEKDAGTDGKPDARDRFKRKRELAQREVKKVKKTGTEGLARIRSILTSSAAATSSRVPSSEQLPGAETREEKTNGVRGRPISPSSAPDDTSSQQTFSRNPEKEQMKRARSKSPVKRKKVAKTCVSFEPLLGGVNARSVVMRRRLESEYGLRPAHQMKMGYFSYMAEKEGGADKAMELMENSLEEGTTEETKVKKTVQRIANELTRSKPDADFLTRLLKNTVQHNKRVLEELAEMDRQREKSLRDEEGESIRIANLSELVRMYLKEGAGNATKVSSSSGSKGPDAKTEKMNPVQMPRVATALFGVSQGTVLQKRLNAQYGLGGSDKAEKKAEILAKKTSTKKSGAKVPPTRRKRPQMNDEGRGRLFFNALARGISLKKSITKK